MFTFADLVERLKQEDELTILEILDLDSSSLIPWLEDLIVVKQDKIRDYYGEDEQDLDREEESY